MQRVVNGREYISLEFSVKMHWKPFLIGIYYIMLSLLKNEVFRFSIVTTVKCSNFWCVVSRAEGSIKIAWIVVVVSEVSPVVGWWVVVVPEDFDW